MDSPLHVSLLDEGFLGLSALTQVFGHDLLETEEAVACCLMRQPEQADMTLSLQESGKSMCADVRFRCPRRSWSKSVSPSLEIRFSLQESRQ